MNRILRTGVQFAATLAEDRDLRHELHYLEARFGDVQPISRLTIQGVEQAARALTRLTETSAAALTLLRLLLDAQGVTFIAANESTPTPGFLFDMNKFFQRLVSRFLRANLSGLRIEDEHSIRELLVFATDGNSRNRAAPMLRPDYALFGWHEAPRIPRCETPRYLVQRAPANPALPTGDVCTGLSQSSERAVVCDYVECGPG